MAELTRRRVLGGLAWSAGIVACRSKDLAAPRRTARFDGFPVQRIDSFLTPTADFFVRDHFGVPDDALRDPSDWSIHIDGEVQRPRVVRLAELQALPTADAPVTLECAGNAGHNGLGWPGGPRAWGGASTASFQGFSLAALLALAKPKESAREVVLVGADIGAEKDAVREEPFARSVPLSVASSPEAILATGMNGRALPPLHGGPARAILPGRYATDSVKWLTRLTVLSGAFDGFFQMRRYRRATPADPAGVALDAWPVQSEIIRPKIGERLPVGLWVDVTGVAWGGTGGVARVELSTDGGQTFAPATFVDPPRPHCWQRWRWAWQPRQPGPRLVLARAVDAEGVAQPMASAEELGLGYSVSGPDRIQYGNNSCAVIPVTVA